MTALSDKAKGKQRATDAEDDAGPSQALPKTKPLVIRFTEGLEDLDLLVEEKDAVRDVKRKVSPMQRNSNMVLMRSRLEMHDRRCRTGDCG